MSRSQEFDPDPSTSRPPCRCGRTGSGRSISGQPERPDWITGTYPSHHHEADREARTDPRVAVVVVSSDRKLTMAQDAFRRIRRLCSRVQRAQATPTNGCSITKPSRSHGDQRCNFGYSGNWGASGLMAAAMYACLQLAQHTGKIAERRSAGSVRKRLTLHVR
jgi:hypothetical protein